MTAHDEHWEPPRAAVGGRALAGAGVALAVVAAVLLARADDGGDAGLPVEQEVATNALADLPEHYTARPPIGRWRPLSESPLAPRTGHTAVWTGEEMIVLGGVDEHGVELTDGAAYDPAGDVWRLISPPPLPPDLVPPVAAAWTGPGEPPHRHGEVVLWTDTRERGPEVGLAYNPLADRWRWLRQAPLQRRVGHALVWTGGEVLVWGGFEPGTGAGYRHGAAYDPATDRWRLVTGGPLAARHDPAAAGADGEAALWGGGLPGTSGWELTDGALYRAADDSWTVLPPLPAHASPGVAPPRLVWLDGEVVLDARLSDEHGERVVAVFDPRAWDWRLAPRPLELRDHPVLVAGAAGAVVFWGGMPRPGRPMADGAVFSPSTGGWRPMIEGPAPLRGQTAVWTGSELLVWGGADPSGRVTNDGAAFDLAGR